MDQPYVRCLMVETGQEGNILRLLGARRIGRGLCPLRTRIRKIRGTWRQDMIRLLPGYVFVFTEREEPIRRFYQLEHMLRILRYDREPEGYLRGADLEFALLMRELDGKLDLLEAVEEDGFIRVTDPLLEALRGRVLSVQRGKRQAEVQIELMGEPVVLHMNYRLTGRNGKPLDPAEETVIEMLEDESDEWITAWTPDFSDDLIEKLDLETEGETSYEKSRG